MTCAPGRRATVRAATVLAAGALAPSPAAAHAFAERYDLPLPLGFYLAGAAVAVALSFLGSFAFLAPGRTWRLHRDLPVPRSIARAARATLTGVATAILAMVLVIGLFGPDSPTRNFATVFIWVVWWVGFALFTALVIDLWTPANPVRAVIAGLVPRAAGGTCELPVGAGAMAVTGLLAISWLELVSDWSESPRAMALIVVIYLGLTLAAVSRWGAEPWFGTADPLARLFSTLGALAPLAVVPGGIRLRLPGSGLGGLDPGGWGAVFIVSLIAIVLFDGLSETPLWAGLLDWVTRSPDLRPHLIALREAGVDILKLLRSVGLIATVGAAVAAYGALCLAVWRAGSRTVPAGRIFSAFAASLLPIAVAYHLAHYVSYLALAGQLMLPILSDPLGLGWDLLGTATRRVQLGVIGAQDVWWIAAGALVAGHGLSVVVAHAAAGQLFPDRRRAILSQVPMMVFMVTLTAASLWILAQPIVA